MKRRPADPLYVELSREVARAGYFATSPGGYLWRGALLIALFAITYVSLLYIATWSPSRSPWCSWPSSSPSWPQLAYLSHDAGHRAITRDRRWIQIIGHFGMTFLTGFSFSWWMHSHDNHHEELFCRKKGIAYREQGFWSAVVEVFVHLRRVGRLADAAAPAAPSRPGGTALGLREDRGAA